MSDKTSTQLPITSLFPNIATIIGLCFGMSSIRYALEQRWELAVALLLVSAFIDGMDGRLARMLNASTDFGAQLDSLADFVNFGVAPAFLVYSWGLSAIEIRGLGWAISLIYTICCGIRLARFNTLLNKNKDEDKNYFFGVPAPCGACLMLLPIVLSFQYELIFFRENPIILSIYTLIVSLLMSSQLPTISLKNVKINSDYILPCLILAAIFVVGLIIEPWLALPILCFAYILSIPVSIAYYFYKKKSL